MEKSSNIRRKEKKKKRRGKEKREEDGDYQRKGSFGDGRWIWRKDTNRRPVRWREKTRLSQMEKVLESTATIKK